LKSCIEIRFEFFEGVYRGARSRHLLEIVRPLIKSSSGQREKKNFMRRESEQKKKKKKKMGKNRKGVSRCKLWRRRRNS